MADYTRGLMAMGPGINPNLQAQGRNALASALRNSPRNALLDPEFYTRDLANSAVNYFSDPENSLRALSIAPIPGVSDVAGLAADALMYKNKPEERNWLNYGLTGLGALPLMPAIAGIMSKADKTKDLAYQISHRPMQDAGGASRLHDLLPAFGDDIYGKNALQFFGSGDAREKDVLRVLHSLRGKPDAEVTIYRGVPKGSASMINAGDWVTLSPKVAADYGDQVLSMKVKASDVTSWPDSLLEFGYFPVLNK